jgi:hypothetical protein
VKLQQSLSFVNNFLCDTAFLHPNGEAAGEEQREEQRAKGDGRRARGKATGKKN